MTFDEIQNLASTWMVIKSGTEEAFDKMYDLLHDDPENAWLVIQEIASRELNDEVKGNLAAGPLEDLLALHGKLFIDRIESKAKSDLKFANLLGGVWQNSINLEIWNRIQKARSKVW